jgi:hypothetical protein
MKKRGGSSLKDPPIFCDFCTNAPPCPRDAGGESSENIAIKISICYTEKKQSLYAETNRYRNWCNDYSGKTKDILVTGESGCCDDKKAK